VLNVNFRTPATHKMAPWVRTAFIDFLPRYLFIQRPDPDPSSDDVPELASGQLPTSVLE
jgi:nicotinic acetylcholine receptor